jgi:Rad3-related DNA helicase
MEVKYIEEIVEKNFFKLNFKPREIGNFSQKDIVVNIIDEIINNDTRNIILRAPIGSGKSIIAAVTALTFNEILAEPKIQSHLITPTKLLSDQYKDTFNYDSNFTVVKGANNFKCLLTPKNNAESCIQSSLEKKIKTLSYGDENYETTKESLNTCEKCEFYIQKKNILNKKILVTNLSWSVVFSKNIYSNPNTKYPIPKLAIYDEAHTISDQIISSFDSIFSKENLESEIVKLKKLFENFKNFLIKKNKVLITNLEKTLFAEILEDDKKILSFLKSFIIAYYDNYLMMLEHCKNNKDIISSKDISILLDSFAKNEYTEIIVLINKISEYEENESVDNEELCNIKELLLYLSRMKNNLAMLFSIYDENGEFEYESLNIKDGTISNKTYFVGDRLRNLIKTYSYIDDTIIFKLVFINSIWEDLSIYKYKIFMSGTVEKEFFDLEFSIPDSKFIYVPDIFPLENKLIVLPNYIEKLNYYKLNDSNFYKRFLNNIIDIINNHFDLNQNGLILTHSFKITKDITYALKKSNSRIKIHSYMKSDSNMVSLENKKVFENYKKDIDKGYTSVFISPSAFEGVDAKDNYGNYIIIPKTPYPVSNSRYKYIVSNYSRYYDYLLYNKLEQGVGRASRSEKDKSIIYLLDQYSSLLLKNSSYKHLFLSMNISNSKKLLLEFFDSNK